MFAGSAVQLDRTPAILTAPQMANRNVSSTQPDELPLVIQPQENKQNQQDF
jgi:hypothetical protein